MDNENQQHNQPQSSSPLQQLGHPITPDSSANNQPPQPTLVPPNVPTDNPSGFNQPSNTSSIYPAGQPQPVLSIQQPATILPRKSKLPALISVILLVLLLVAVGAYAYHLTQHKTV